MPRLLTLTRSITPQAPFQKQRQHKAELRHVWAAALDVGNTVVAESPMSFRKMNSARGSSHQGHVASFWRSGLAPRKRMSHRVHVAFCSLLRSLSSESSRTTAISVVSTIPNASYCLSAPKPQTAQPSHKRQQTLHEEKPPQSQITKMKAAEENDKRLQLGTYT